MAPSLVASGSCRVCNFLRLGRNSLHGTIPSKFRLLTGLISLDLSSNALTGTIPTEWNPTALVLLNLPSNNLTPEVVPCLPSALILVDCDSNNGTTRVRSGIMELPRKLSNVYLELH